MKPLKSTYNARNNLICFQIFSNRFIINFQKKLLVFLRLNIFNYDYVVIKIGLKFEISTYLDIWSK